MVDIKSCLDFGVFKKFATMKNFGERCFLLMQVLLTWHITNSANEWGILNGPLSRQLA
jgi:hypothetical protein